MPKSERTVRCKPFCDIQRYWEKLLSRGQTMDGKEIPDDTPMAPPIGFIKTPSLAERIRDMVRSEHLRLAAESVGAETFEEADDFNIDDDPFPGSEYEFDDNFDPPASDRIDRGSPPLGEGEGARGKDAEAVKPATGSDGSPSAAAAEGAPKGSASAST